MEGIYVCAYILKKWETLESLNWTCGAKQDILVEIPFELTIEESVE